MQNLPMHIYSALQTAENPDILLRGFQKYLNTEYTNEYAAYDIISTHQNVSIRYYKSQGKAGRALFIIPSLINGPEIFDLTKEVSFIRYILNQKIDVYLVDWGGLSQGYDGGLSDLFASVLFPLWQESIQHHSTPMHVIGYCLGGTLSASFFADYRQEMLPQSLTFLATPFDFHVENSSWNYVRQNQVEIKAQINLQNALSQRMLQSHFINLQPDYITRKFQEFLKMSPGSSEEQRFIAVERWLNEGHDLPPLLALDIIEKYFIRNNATEDLKKLSKIPMSFIFSENDQIVPYASAKIIEDIHSSIYKVQSHCGHVGMMVGGDAQSSVWQPFTEYISSVAAQQN